MYFFYALAIVSSFLGLKIWTGDSSLGPLIKAQEAQHQLNQQQTIPQLVPTEKSVETQMPLFTKQETNKPEEKSNFFHTSLPSTALPAAPEAHTEEAAAKEITPEEEGEAADPGIDTSNLEQPRGNWFFKQHRWNQAEEKYNDTRPIIQNINNLWMQFFAQRTALDKAILDPFFVDISYEEGELSSMLSMLVDQIEQDNKKEGVLSDEERTLLESLKEDRDLVMQLHRDVQNIIALRNAADEIIERVVEQKNRVARYEQEMWEGLREIARVLSHTQAQQLFYKVKAAGSTIKKIARYLEQDLQRYFDKLTTNAKEQVERIKSALNTLKEKGIDLKKHFSQIKEEQIVEYAPEEQEEPKPIKEPKKTGIWRIPLAILNGLKQIPMLFVKAITWLPMRIWCAIRSLFK